MGSDSGNDSFPLNGSIGDCVTLCTEGQSHFYELAFNTNSDETCMEAYANALQTGLKCRAIHCVTIDGENKEYCRAEKLVDMDFLNACFKYDDSARD